MRNTQLLVAATAATSALASLALSQSTTTSNPFNTTNLYPTSSKQRTTTRTKYPRDLSFADPTAGNISANANQDYLNDEHSYYQKIRDSPLGHGHHKKLIMLDKTEAGYYIYNNITLKVCIMFT